MTGRAAWFALLLAWPLAAAAQNVAPPHHDRHAGMRHMAAPVPAASTAVSEPPVRHGHAGHHGMQEKASQPAPRHDHAMAGHAAHAPARERAGTLPAHGHGHASPAPRSPDYSDGIDPAAMSGMDMADDRPVGRLVLDHLEAFHDRQGSGQRWDLQGWYGGDIDKLWLRSEGERRDGNLGDGSIELLWSHALSAFWDTQLGVRHDLGPGPRRTWAAFGVEGLAPYFLDVDATLYIGTSGRTAARLRAGYELLFTQRLILEPELEANLYGKADPARGHGAGLADARLALRLRYEIRRRFAPYIGIVWNRRFGGTADAARAEGVPVSDHQWVAGLRLWF